MDVFSDIQKKDQNEIVDKSFEPLSSVLAELEFTIISAPHIITKEKLSEWLVKHLSTEIDQIYIVGWRDNEDPFYINFPQMLDKIQISRNTLFIVEDLVTFSGYMGEISLMSHTHNFYLIVQDSGTERITQNLITKYWPDSIQLWPSVLDVPIDMVYNQKTSLISGGQLRDYNHAFIQWRKLEHSSYTKIDPPDSLFGYLNVYLDSKVPSLESVSKDIAIQRSPKFRDIFQSILFHNKKRHFISMISGERGIIAFESLYGKLDNDGIPLHVIRSSDPLRVKEDKLESINSSNSPLVVLSDFNFTEDMSIKNIDYYHITNGGKNKDVLSILSLIKGNNYTGTYPRKLTINNYITETPTTDIPVDSLMEKQFFPRLNEIIDYSKISKASDYLVVFVEGELNVVLDN